MTSPGDIAAGPRACPRYQLGEDDVPVWVSNELLMQNYTVQHHIALNVVDAMTTYKALVPQFFAQKVDLSVNPQAIWLIWTREQIAAPIRIRIFQDFVEGEWLLDEEDCAVVDQAAFARIGSALTGTRITAEFPENQFKSWESGLAGTLISYQEQARLAPEVYQPDVVFTLSRLGHLAFAQGAFDRGAQYFAKAVTLLREECTAQSPQLAQALLAVGQAYLALGRIEEAEAPLRDSSQLCANLAQTTPALQQTGWMAFKLLAVVCYSTGREGEGNRMVAIASQFIPAQ